MKQLTTKLLAILSVSVLLMAFQCDDDGCSFEDFEGYAIVVENNKAVYTIDELFYLKASTPAQLIDYCGDSETSIFVNEPERFIDGFFLVNLREPFNDPVPLNGELAREHFDISYEIGDSFDRNSCDDDQQIALLPELSSNQQNFEYRLAIKALVVGDYAITIGYYGGFSELVDLHSEVFLPYSIEGELRFKVCNETTYKRSRAQDTYYFSVTN